MDSNTQDFQLPLPMFGDERRKYTFYAIVNTVTGKRYVGITRDYDYRKSSHLSKLRKGIHHSIKLQNSFIKYSEKAFKWEIIERAIYLLEDAFEREKHWIAHFDSYENGYNMTRGGDNPNTTPCSWNGLQFDSVIECAEYFNINRAAMSYRIRQGYLSDDDVKAHKKPIVWEGVTYKSCSELARVLGVSISTTTKYLRLGYGCYEDIQESPSTPVECTWNGITYSSIVSAAAANNMSETAMRFRVSNGWVCDEDTQLIERGELMRVACTWNGVQYASRTDAANALGISLGEMRRRIRLGYVSDEEMIGSDWSAKTTTWNGVEYPSRRDAAKAIGVPEGTFYRWVSSGYTCDEEVPHSVPGVPTPVVWEGTEYGSITECAKALGVSRGYITRRLPNQ